MSNIMGKRKISKNSKAGEGWEVKDKMKAAEAHWLVYRDLLHYFLYFHCDKRFKKSTYASYWQFYWESSSMAPIPTTVLDINKMSELEVARCRQVGASLSWKILITLFWSSFYGTMLFLESHLLPSTYVLLSNKKGRKKNQQ